ncbi:MarR family winged helix-turn-helix transcriptional regulator [Marinoscillum sp.]|uniref:MarR family winged helix-turn-helix transcriptional regulator n=1 Tax=Marinoscillum sp. TaxID=2024838 RepID=UPI003BAC3B9D
MKDFAKELGCLGFTMRIKRISDALMHDGKKMYKQLGLDIEPNWYVIFRLLKQEGELSVTEVSDRVGMAHPSIISLTNKMIKAGYLTSSQCTDDNRRRLLTLSTKAEEKLPEFERVWKAGEAGVIDAVADTEIMNALTLIEERFGEKGFRERTLDKLNNNK